LPAGSIDTSQPPSHNPAMRQNKKKSGYNTPEALGDILARLQKGQVAVSDASRVFDAWDKAVDERIRKNTRPSVFRNGLLIVGVKSSPWAQELEFVKVDLCRRLNEALGRNLVTEMRFKTGAY